MQRQRRRCIRLPRLMSNSVICVSWPLGFGFFQLPIIGEREVASLANAGACKSM